MLWRYVFSTSNTIFVRNSTAILVPLGFHYLFVCYSIQTCQFFLNNFIAMENMTLSDRTDIVCFYIWYLLLWYLPFFLIFFIEKCHFLIFFMQPPTWQSASAFVFFVCWSPDTVYFLKIKTGLTYASLGNTISIDFLQQNTKLPQVCVH